MVDGKFTSMADITAAISARLNEEEPNGMMDHQHFIRHSIFCNIMIYMVNTVIANVAAVVAAAGEGASELLKPHKESEAVLALWSSAIGDAGFASCVLSLKNHVLPLPLPAVNLLFATACLLQYPSLYTRDICGDPSWDAIRNVRLVTKTVYYVSAADFI